VRIAIPDARLGLTIFFVWVAFVAVTVLAWHAVRWWRRAHPRERQQPFTKALPGRFARGAARTHPQRERDTQEQRHPTQQ